MKVSFYCGYVSKCTRTTCADDGSLRKTEPFLDPFSQDFSSLFSLSTFSFLPLRKCSLSARDLKKKIKNRHAVNLMYLVQN